MKMVVSMLVLFLSVMASVFAADMRMAMFESDKGALDAFAKDLTEVRGTAYSDSSVYVAYPHGFLYFNRYGWLLRQIPDKHEVADIFWSSNHLYAAESGWRHVRTYDYRLRWKSMEKLAGKAAWLKLKRDAVGIPESQTVPEGYEYLPDSQQGRFPRFGRTSFTNGSCRIEFFELRDGQLVDITKCRNYKRGIGHMRGDCQPRRIEDRNALIDPVDEGDLRLRPTFTSCSVSFGCNEYAKIKLEYRKRGAQKWTSAKLPPNYKETREFRGSIVNLDEDTEYEVRFVLRDSRAKREYIMAEGTFRTWASVVPIAKTIEIDPATAKFPIVVSDRGIPEGWIRYTAKGGQPLVAKGASSVFVVKDAAYVVLDDMDLSGNNGGSVIALSDSHAVRLRNLNIHDWSEPGVGVYTLTGLGRFVRNPNSVGWGIAEYGVYIGHGMTETVVERCWIHDPCNRSCSWYYSHPCGPMAILAGGPQHSTVIRWNDLVASDFHSWDDAIGGGAGNFMENGGFNRDADIYGNFFSFANDDCIELDGGQQNIRVFGNRFENSYTGVSVQGNTVSPSYVYRNLFTGMGEMMDHNGETIKTSGADLTPFENRTYIWNNTLWGRGTGFRSQPMQIADVRNNLLVGEYQAFGPFHAGAEDGGPQKNTRFYSNTVERAGNPWPGVRYAKTEFLDLEKTDLTPVTHISGSAVANFIGPNPVQGTVQVGENATMWPIRPLAFTLDTLRIDLGKRREFTVRAKVRGKVEIPFAVVQNRDFDWFTVEPRSGTLKNGMVFTVKLDESKMTERHFYRGVFLVRTPDGLSRPVSLNAETDWEAPIKCDDAKFAAYAMKDEAKESGGWRTYTFDIPKDGTYWFFMHGRKAKGAGMPQYRVRVDGCDEEVSRQQATDYNSWTMIAPGRGFGSWLREYDLKAGKHTISLKLGKDDFAEWDAIAVSDSPAAFDRR